MVTLGAPAQGPLIQMGTFNSSKTFPYFVEDIAPVARGVMRHFEQQDFEVTETNIPTVGTQVSIRRGSTLEAIIGMKTALNRREPESPLFGSTERGNRRVTEPKGGDTLS